MPYCQKIGNNGKISMKPKINSILKELISTLRVLYNTLAQYIHPDSNLLSIALHLKTLNAMKVAIVLIRYYF